MALIRHSDRTFGQFIPNGSTPTAQNAAETFTLAPVTGAAMSLLRTRTDIELYIRCVAAGSAKIDSSIWEETLAVVGVEVFPSTAGELISDTPLTNTTPNPASLGWVTWDYLYPEVMNIDFNAPQVATVVFRPDGGTIDVQSRRAVGVHVGLDIWMPWEIQDGSGLINTTTAGVTYNLGVRFAQQVWWETKS
jgi:hypothetical protein